MSAETGASGPGTGELVLRQRYQELFENVPIGLWVEDFSAVKQLIDEARTQGVSDWREYFAENPEVVERCAAAIRVVDINTAALDLHRAESKDDLLGNLDKIFTEETMIPFVEELICLAEGRNEFRGEGSTLTLDGEKIWTALWLRVAPGHEDTWSRVLASTADISARKRAERDLARKLSLVETLTEFEERVRAQKTRDVLPRALEFFEETLDIPHSSVALIEPSGSAFRLASPAEGVADLEQGGVLPFPSTVLSEVVKGSEPWYRSDLRAQSTDYEVDRKLIAAGFLSDFLVPLTHEGECIGTLNCASPKVDGIPEDTRRLVHLLAPRLAGYIANARLFDDLEASERRFRTLVSNLPGAVYRCDADEEWAVQFVSDEMERLTGYPAGDFHGGTGWIYSSIVHPDDLEKVRRVVSDAVERREPYVLEYRIVTAEGEEKWVYEKGRADYGEDGAPLWLDGAIFDVTDRKLAEQALKESEALLVEAQRIGRAASWDWDVARDRLTMTQELHNLLGTNEATFAPNAASFFELVHPEDRERVAERMNAALERGEPYNVQFRLEQPGGAVVHLHSIGHVDRDDGGKAARMVGMVQDISERIRAEEDRRQLENQMRESQKLESLGVLAGGIAHDFNNLLVSVLGGTELALQYIDSSSPAREHLEDVMTAADRAADLANQMLAYSGKGQFMVEPTDLSALIAEISQLVEVSVSKKIRVALELAEDLPAVQVDVTQIRQIALNLVTNAAEAIGNKAGTISIATGSVDCARDYLAEGYAADEARDGVYVYMEVTDSGAGMDSQTRKNIFDPFFTTKSTGRGLGLAAVLGIVRGHKGAIRVESEPNLGTTIRVLLPASDQAPTQRAPEPVPDEEWQGNGTILLADDEPTVRSVAHAMLSRLGFKVLVAEDGEEGVEMFRRHVDEIVLVVLDLAMPTMGGDEAFGEIRRIKSDAKVVLSSGFTEQDTTNRFADRGLAGFIQKPYRLAELTRTIRAALES